MFGLFQRPGYDTLDGSQRHLPLSWLVAGGLFYDVFSVTRLYSVDDMVVSKWLRRGKGFGRKQL
jgi:hypothetical protein